MISLNKSELACQFNELRSILLTPAVGSPHIINMSKYHDQYTFMKQLFRSDDECSLSDLRLCDQYLQEIYNDKGEMLPYGFLKKYHRVMTSKES